MNVLITLCARGGSKGIPGKNIKELNGLPLIAYSIKHAQKFAEAVAGTDILLSTDDDEIKTVAEKYNLFTKYVRPTYLAGDTVGKIDVLSDALKYQETLKNKKYEILLDLDITSPLRTTEELIIAFNTIISDDKAFNLFSVSRPHKNPYFNVVEQKADGYYKLVKPSDTKSRQTAPQVFDMNASFYFYKRIFFEKQLKSAITEKSLIHIMNHVCFDLDEPLDFEIMEYLVSKDKIGITL